MPLSGQYSHGVRLNPAQQKPWPDDFRAIWWGLFAGTAHRPWLLWGRAHRSPGMVQI